MEPTRLAPGTFCWPELITGDAAGAKRFYGKLMPGWTTVDEPIPGGESYTMINQDEGSVGGMFEFDDGMRKMGIPSHWLTYVSVEDVRASADRAQELGGTVIRPPMDVMDVGSLAVLQDPSGAAFAVWQAKGRQGTFFTDGRPGTMCWNELVTTDVDRCTTFYGNLFGWKPGPGPVPDMDYQMFAEGDEHRAGVMPMPAECRGIPSHWMIYFSVADCDAAARTAESAGGQILVPPTDIPGVGRFAALKDPQGAPFSVIKLGAG